MAGLRKYKSLYSSTCNSFGTGEAVTITPGSVVGLPTGVCVLTFDRVDSAGTATPTKMERIKGTVSGGNFVVASGGRGYDGSTEQAHTSPVVEMIWNAADWNDAVDALTNVVSATTGALDTTKVIDLTTAQALTGKTYNGLTLTSTTGTLTLAAGKTLTVNDTMTLAGAGTITFPAATDTATTIAATQTLTNKTVTPRVGTVTDSATPTINTDNVDMFTITALTQAINTMTTNLSGAPTNGQKLIIRITGTASRAITWGASFVASTVALPTTTSGTTMLTVGFIYDTVAAKWVCSGVA